MEFEFSRMRGVRVRTGNSTPVFSLVASLDADLRRLGYALDNTLALALMSADTTEVESIRDSLIRLAKQEKGVRNYRPMYPNFPRQVMEASDAELYLNAIFHYFGDAVGLRILPHYDEKARPALDFDKDKVVVLRLVSDDEVQRAIHALMNSASAFSKSDIGDIQSLDTAEFLAAYDSMGSIRNKENAAVLAAYVIWFKGRPKAPQTATDVLRTAVALHGGDVSLSEPTNFKFSRPDRRALVRMLERVSPSSITEDMMRHQQAWKRLGECLHPAEFTSNRAVLNAFATVRGDRKFESFNSQVEACLREKDVIGALALLEQRPGELVRRVDHLLRLDVRYIDDVIAALDKHAHKASPSVLIQASSAIKVRDRQNRVFFPKGSVTKLKVKKNDLSRLGRPTVTKVVMSLNKALQHSLADRPSLGKVYVDPELMNYTVPFGLRNANKAISTVGRGSRISLSDDTNVVRMFIWWKDTSSPKDSYSYYGGGRVDIDLSAVMLDEGFGHVGSVWYGNLRSEGIVHSGDITSAPNGASEFIDVDIERVRARNPHARYIAMTLNSYTGQPFVELPECFAGVMERRDMGSGEIYDPRTVTNRFDVTAGSRYACPFIFDLVERKMIWVDMSRPVDAVASNVVTSERTNMTLVEALVSERGSANLYDLFAANGYARGTLVENRADADIVFAVDGDVKPTDIDTILDEYV